MRRRRVSYRPSRAQGTLSMAVGVIFVIIGLVMVIPLFGPFGILWTLIAVGITVTNGYQAFGKKYSGPEIHIEEEEDPPAPRDESGHDHIPSTALDTRGRLQQLEDLKKAGLLTQAEYEQKRKEIIEEL